MRTVFTVLLDLFHVAWGKGQNSLLLRNSAGLLTGNVDYFHSNYLFLALYI